MSSCRDEEAVVEVAQNSIEAAAARVVGRPFPPGVSGNPGGRPKGLARYVRELVGDDGRRIADFMLAVLEDESERIETRMQAANWLADRGFGRAHVPVDVKEPEKPAQIVFQDEVFAEILAAKQEHGR